MSFLVRTAGRSMPALSSYSSPARAFHASTLRAALSEQDRHKPEEERHREVDHHKNDSLQKQKEGKGHWKAELGSSSEEAIKADRGELSAAEEDIKKLQKETEQVLHKKDN